MTILAAVSAGALKNNPHIPDATAPNREAPFARSKSQDRPGKTPYLGEGIRDKGHLAWQLPVAVESLQHK